MTHDLYENPIAHDPTAEVRAYWDDASRGYDELHGHGLFGERARRAWCRLLARLLGPEPLRVLDVATGTGFLAFRLAELGHDVVGVDVSPAMLGVARREAQRRYPDAKLELRVCTADLDDLREASFDAVVSRHLLWTLPDPERTIRRWRQVLVPGGCVIAVDGLWFGDDLRARMRSAVGHTLARARGIPHEHGGGTLYRDQRSETFPLMALKSHDPATNAFARAGLTSIRGEYLDGIDTVERDEMPLALRLSNHWRRYLVEGTSPG